ncbi:MAG: DUF5309 family protein [Campylobacterota bacterium]|nr:DUF5309 family protein [Campylobacterota bacterium]
MISTLVNGVVQKPSIVDAIIKQGVATAPLIEMLSSGTLTAPKHSWLNDRYEDAKDNAHLELSDLDENIAPTKTKTENISQILKKDIGVTRRQMSMSQYGGKEWEYQVAKKGKEHLKDIEFALLGLGHVGGVFSAPVAGTATKAPRMGGLFYFVPNEQRQDFSSDKDGDNTTGILTDFSMDTLHSFLEPLWLRGAMEDDTFTVLLGSKLKQSVNRVCADYLVKDGSGKADGTFNPTIQKIETDFGTVKFRLHRQFAGDALADKMLAGKFNEARIMYIERTSFGELPTTKTAKYGRYYSDLSLEVKNGDMFASAEGLK